MFLSILSGWLAEEPGLEEPVGKMVQIDDSTRLTIVGEWRTFICTDFGTLWNRMASGRHKITE